MIEYQKGDSSAALDYLDKTVAEKPDFGKAWYSMGVVAFQRQDRVRYKRALERLDALAPELAAELRRLQ